LAITLFFSVCLGLTSNSYAALYTLFANAEYPTSSFGNTFRTPTIDTILNCDGNCSLNGDAVLVSFVMLSTALEYNQAILRLYDNNGYLLPLGAGYMAGSDISPTGVSRFIFGGTNVNTGLFDFNAPPLNAGVVTNTLFMTFPGGSLDGATINFGFKNAGDTTFGVATWSLMEMTSVPIPAAVWLLGSGLVGIVGLRKKFNK